MQDAIFDQRIEDMRNECAEGPDAARFNISGLEFEQVYDELFGYTCFEMKQAKTFQGGGLSDGALIRIGMLLARKVEAQLKQYAEEASI